MTDYVFMALAPLIAFVPLLILMRRNAPKIYDRAIIHMTALWYKEVLDVVPKNSKVLDIGIGTATALLENLGTVRGKNLTIDGVDYENSYVNAANENISARDATDSVKVHYGSVYDNELLISLADGSSSSSSSSSSSAPSNTRRSTRKNKQTRLFDSVYFSGSISLMPSIKGALHAVCSPSVLAPGGRIFITQTYQHTNVPFLFLIKPLIKYITTIDFGKLTFESDILEVYEEFCKEGKFMIERHEVIEGSVDNIFQKAYLTELRRRT